MTTMTESTTKKEPGHLAVILAYFLIYVVWGSTYYFIGVALRGFPPFLLGGLRFSAAGILPLTFSRIRGGHLPGSLIRKSAVSGIILLFIDMAVIMLAQQYLSSSPVAILASSTVIWIMALDIPMWKTNFKLPAVSIGIVTGFLGVGLLFLEQLFHGGKNVHHEYGVVLLVVGRISWALGTLYAKYKSSSEEEVNDFAGAAWQMLFAGGMFWVCSFLGRETRCRQLGSDSVRRMAFPGLFDPVRFHPCLYQLHLAPQGAPGNGSRHPCLRKPACGGGSGYDARRGGDKLDSNNGSLHHPFQHLPDQKTFRQPHPERNSMTTLSPNLFLPYCTNNV